MKLTSTRVFHSRRSHVLLVTSCTCQNDESCVTPICRKVRKESSGQDISNFPGDHVNSAECGVSLGGGKVEKLAHHPSTGRHDSFSVQWNYNSSLLRCCI